MPAHARAAAAPGTAGQGRQTEPTISPEEAKIWLDRFSKAKGAIACPKCIESAVDKDHTPTCGTLSLTPSSNMPLMVMCNACKKATRSVKLVKIAITTAEAKWQNTSPPTVSVTPSAMQYTSEQLQQLSAKVAQLTVQLSTVRGEREALQAGAAAPEVSADDRLTALSEEMLKMTKQNKDLRAEITAIRGKEASPRAASEDSTTMFRDVMVQQTAINSANKAATEKLSKTMSNFMTQLIENQNARPAGDPRPEHPTMNPPARSPAAPPTTVPPQVPVTPAFPSYSEMAKRNLPASYKATDSFDKDLKERASVFEKRIWLDPRNLTDHHFDDSQPDHLP